MAERKHSEEVLRAAPARPAAQRERTPASAPTPHPASLLRGPLAPQQLLQLQRAAGNHATARLLRGRGRPPIQAKLAVTPAGDRYEQEADLVAEQVMRLTGLPGGGDQAAQRRCEDRPCPAKLAALPLMESDEAQAQRSADEAGLRGGHVEPGVEQSVQAARGGGAPFGGRLRESMEGAFGADFGGVRVHTGAAADALARSLGARAFTTGRDLFFRAGEYRPETEPGRRLLAHELTHVLQQGGGALRRKPQPEAAAGCCGGATCSCGGRGEVAPPAPRLELSPTHVQREACLEPRDTLYSHYADIENPVPKRHELFTNIRENVFEANRNQYAPLIQTWNFGKLAEFLKFYVSDLSFKPVYRSQPGRNFEAEVDHRIPVQAGGCNSVNNAAILAGAENSPHAKGPGWKNLPFVLSNAADVEDARSLIAIYGSQWGSNFTNQDVVAQLTGPGPHVATKQVDQLSACVEPAQPLPHYRDVTNAGTMQPGGSFTAIKEALFDANQKAKSDLIAKIDFGEATGQFSYCVSDLSGAPIFRKKPKHDWEANLDHIIPAEAGGCNTARNVQVLSGTENSPVNKGTAWKQLPFVVRHIQTSYDARNFVFSYHAHWAKDPENVGDVLRWTQGTDFEGLKKTNPTGPVDMSMVDKLLEDLKKRGVKGYENLRGVGKVKRQARKQSKLVKTALAEEKKKQPDKNG